MYGDQARVSLPRFSPDSAEDVPRREAVLGVRVHHALHADPITIALKKCQRGYFLVHFIQGLLKQLELGIEVARLRIDKAL
jgi:hypothetical protein